MSDRPYIYAGLLVFLVLITFPFWNGLGQSASGPEPDLDTPVIQQLAVKECVEPAAFMKANHMKLLEDWRTLALREGRRSYQASSGKTYEISLEKTCLKCHSNKEQFCDRCHNYAGVKPDCWNCHVPPGKGR